MVLSKYVYSNHLEVKTAKIKYKIGLTAQTLQVIKVLITYILAQTHIIWKTMFHMF